MQITIVSLDNSEKIKSGGKHIHQTLLKEGLESCGHSVTSIFPKKNHHFFLVRIGFKILSVFGIASSSDAFRWTLKRHKASIIKQIKSQIVPTEIFLSQDPVAATAVNQSREDGSNFRHSLTLHGYLGLESLNYGKYQSKAEKEAVLKAANYYEAESLNNLDQLITVDSRISKYVINTFPKYKAKPKVLLNAINPEIFGKTSNTEKIKFKETNNIPVDNFIVVIPRRLVIKNGVRVAVLALKELILKGRDNITFLVIGEGPEQSNLENLKKTLKVPDPNLTFMGAIDNSKIPFYYDLADLVIIPSIVSDGIEEATSLSMLEAMASKTPVIVSNIGGMKEVIQDGFNGFTVEENNHQHLALKVLHVLNLPTTKRSTIVLQAYLEINKNHHFKNHAQEYIKKFRQ